MAQQRTRRAHVTRAPLTRDRIVTAAVELADEGGLEALSMRVLGQRLGVEAMSLYNHVANKDDVIDAMVESVLQHVEPVGDHSEWSTALRAGAMSARAALLRHPWACALWMERMPGSYRLRYMEGLLACLARSGLAPDIAHHAYHVVDTYIVGFTAQQATFRRSPNSLPGVADDFLRVLPADQFPRVAEHVHEHLAGDAGVGAFEFGLDLILDGLNRSRAPQLRPPRRQE